MHTPEWSTPAGTKTLKGLLLDGESPYDMYKRLATTSANALGMPELIEPFFDIMWKGWLGPATPVISNLGAGRGLPASCYGIHIEDSIPGISRGIGELMNLSSKGGGVGIYMGDVRGRGVPIAGGGQSEGILPWAKINDSATISTTQNGVRRGASNIQIGIRHPDIKDFLQMRRASRDENLRTLNLHHGVCIPDEFMQSMLAGNPEDQALWAEVMKTRFETGEPCIWFTDNANKHRTQSYINNDLLVTSTNICFEISQYTDSLHSFVCVLSSMNLAKWNEWKDTKAVFYATMFLDGVMEEYIRIATEYVNKGVYEFAKVLRSAVKGRAIGLGAMGWHTLLQSEEIPYDSFLATNLNKTIFQHIKKESNLASKHLGARLGEPEWCKGTGMRNSVVRAVAPTVTNAKICGDISPSIEPIDANALAASGAKGIFIYRNNELEKVLESINRNTEDVWKSISASAGSVQHLDWLSPNQREIFLTAREISQFAIVRQTAERLPEIDQAQSMNLFFNRNVDPTYFTKVHVDAWRMGLKSIYYSYSQPNSNVQIPNSTLQRVAAKLTNINHCEACGG